MPLFHISIAKQPYVDRVFQKTEFMYTEVSFEVYWGKKVLRIATNINAIFTIPWHVIYNLDT